MHMSGDPEAHPADLTLARWIDGTLPSEETEHLSAHLTICDVCAERAAAAGAAAAPEAAVGEEDRVRVRAALARRAGARRRAAGFPARAAALAAAALLSAWVLWFYGGRPARPPHPEDATRAPAAVLPSLIREGWDTRTSRHTLADGSRLVAFPGARLSFSIAPDGTRRLTLREGSVALDIAERAGRFVVSAPAGDAIATGTRFAARAFHLHPAAPERRTAINALAVEVSEGSVRLRSAGGVADLPAGRIGLAVGQMPIRLAATGSPLPPAAAAPHETPEALLAAAAFWGAADDPVSFLKDALAAPRPEARGDAARMACFRPERRFLAILAAAGDRETDPAAHRAIREAIARIGAAEEEKAK